MSTITRGKQDQYVEALKRALDEYEGQHPDSVATLYRQNTASVRIRIVDGGFSGFSKAQRHERVWNFLSERLDDDTVQEISVLLLLAPGEEGSSLMNAEFEDPIPSGF